MSTPGLADDGSLAESLARLSFDVMGRLSRLSAEADMSLTQLRMLAILRDRRLRMAELAAALGVDRSSTSGLIARAERRDLVRRQPAGDDGRSYVVSLTPAGRDFSAALEVRVAAAIRPMFDALRPADRRTLAALLLRMVDRLEGTAFQQP